VPILTNPTSVATGQTTANGSVTTDTGNGEIYYVVTLSPTAPTQQQVKDGLNSSGVAAVDASVSPFLAFPGVVSFTATGLAASTTYFFHFMHEINVFNRSAVVTSPSFTTDASPPIVSRWLRDRSRNAFTRGDL